jgi:hypothetical protein
MNAKTVIVKYLNQSANVVVVDVEGSILEGLQYVKDSRIKGAKLKYMGEWIDVDSFMIAGAEMFAPISKEEAARRDAEQEAWLLANMTFVEFKPMPITAVKYHNSRHYGDYLSVVTHGIEEYKIRTSIPVSERELLSWFSDSESRHMFEKVSG